MKTALLLMMSAGLAQAAFVGAKAIDQTVALAVAKDQMPGAVVLIGKGERTLYYQAYGRRALVPAKEPMTLDTIFDAASLTKVVATTSSLMTLVDAGKLDIDAKVTKYLPEFQGGQSDITVRHLLTHYSGLRPDLDLRPEWSGYETGIEKALHDQPTGPQGAKFVYSDINFILLGEIVHRLTGESLAEYARKTIFEPLEMKHTRFQPPSEWTSQIAPTEQYPGMTAPLRGVVHDETSRFMGGIAGHAGLFTDAEDLAHWSQWLLGKGTWHGKRLVSERTFELFTTVQSPEGMRDKRGLGFDIDSRYSGNRGDLYPVGGFGHTGFTGTSVWVDPSTQSYVIFLSNSVHPKRRPAVTSVRRRIATIAAASLGVRATGKAPVRTGLDVWKTQGFEALKGKKVGLVTNHTGLDAQGARNVDLMVKDGVKVMALFSPEHGIAGKLDQEKIGDSVDEATGIPVFSLYQSKQRGPREEQLEKVDALVFDIQDIGARFYTYMCTLQNVMKEAARLHKAIYVLDRPNPITGTRVEGPTLEPALRSFIGCTEIPLRHGMTMGELAWWMNAEEAIGADLTVVRMEGWAREQWWEETGLPWVNPSPNMRSLTEAILYPGVAMLEGSKNLSVGRGTGTPFEVVGAPWIEGTKWASYLTGRNLKGLRFESVDFTPESSHFTGVLCHGVRISVSDRGVVESTRLGLELASSLVKLYPGKLDLGANRRLIGSEASVSKIEQGVSAGELWREWEAGVAGFEERRKGYLLY